MTNTVNYGLKKPEETDFYSVSAFNDNADIIDAKLKELADGGANVRYVSDEANADFDWIQVQDAEGNWVNSYRAYVQRRDLYMSTANEGGFVAYNGSDVSVAYATSLPSVTFGTAMKFSASNSNGTMGSSVISDLIDLSRFKKIKLHHKSTLSNTYSTNDLTYVSVFVTSAKQQYMGNKIVASQKLIVNKAGTSDLDAELDISTIEGEYYIGICCHVNAGTASTEISNFYME